MKLKQKNLLDKIIFFCYQTYFDFLLENQTSINQTSCITMITSNGQKVRIKVVT